MPKKRALQGKSTSNPIGYEDDAFDVTFSDDLSGSDIHLYQAEQSTVPGDRVTGTWQPDGRDVDPMTVLDSDPRTAFLSVFNGKNPTGDWTLFVADMSTGAFYIVDTWSLRLTGNTVIPEPGNLLLLGMVCLFATRHKWRPVPHNLNKE